MKEYKKNRLVIGERKNLKKLEEIANKLKWHRVSIEEDKDLKKEILKESD